MATEKEDMMLCKAYTMNGGQGLHSYSNNSFYQRGSINSVRELINKAISENLDFAIISSEGTIRVADMGCSAGPNTFIAVQNILEAVQEKLNCINQEPKMYVKLPTFQVFFNDHASNDFNTLFASIPATSPYYLAGVPGSFHGRLFAHNFLHIVHSSYALQWLSQVPKDVSNRNSPAWNKGRVHYSSAGDQTIKAYEDQFASDVSHFLQARAEEVLHGGLVIILLPSRVNGTPHSNVAPNIIYDLLGFSLMDLVKRNVISEETVDSFNIPIYFPSPQELEAVVQRNGQFKIVKMECLPHEKIQNSIGFKAKTAASHTRAGLEPLMKEQFGQDIVDEVFNSLSEKIERSSYFDIGRVFNLFMLLERKGNQLEAAPH